MALYQSLLFLFCIIEATVSCPSTDRACSNPSFGLTTSSDELESPLVSPPPTLCCGLTTSSDELEFEIGHRIVERRCGLTTSSDELEYAILGVYCTRGCGLTTSSDELELLHM